MIDLARSVPVLLVSPLSPCLLSLSSPAALLSPRSLGPCAPCAWIWVWSCLVFGFSRRFLQNQKIPRENQKYQRKPKKTNKTLGKTKQTKFLKVSDPPLDMGLFFLFFWFSRRFLQNQKILRENQKYQRKPKKTKKTLGKTTKKHSSEKPLPQVLRAGFGSKNPSPL